MKALWLLAAGGLGQVAAAQTVPLDSVVERTRAAWLAHDARALVAASDTVRLRLPGLAASAAARPGQAARLLAEYLESAAEQEFVLRELRYVDTGHAYAEFTRRFAVRGTTGPLQETVFVGYRVLDGHWRLREVRVAR